MKVLERELTFISRLCPLQAIAGRKLECDIPEVVKDFNIH